MFAHRGEGSRRLLTVAEVVSASGYSERHVRRMIAEGRIPAYRAAGGRAIRIPATAVEALFSEAVAR